MTAESATSGVVPPMPPRYRLRDLILGDVAFTDDGQRWVRRFRIILRARQLIPELNLQSKEFQSNFGLFDIQCQEKSLPLVNWRGFMEVVTLIQKCDQSRKIRRSSMSCVKLYIRKSIVAFFKVRSIRRSWEFNDLQSFWTNESAAKPHISLYVSNMKLWMYFNEAILVQGVPKKPQA